MWLPPRVEQLVHQLRHLHFRLPDASTLVLADGTAADFAGGGESGRVSTATVRECDTLVVLHKSLAIVVRPEGAATWQGNALGTGTQ